jgi:SAM-dependent methyltransferase
MADSSAPTAQPADPGWHRFTTARTGSGGDTTAVTYGSELPTEPELRLLGPVEGSRILDLGCGSGHNAVTLAQQGAKVIAVDPDVENLDAARARSDAAEVRVELHQSGLAELAFIRSDSIDAALSVMALATTDDLARVFRQVHRVLKPEAPLVCSFPHPAFAMLDPAAEDPLRIARAYDDSRPRTWELDGRDVVDHPRTFADLFTTFHRANFRVDQVIEPTASGSSAAARSGTPYADVMRHVPATLLLRARKQGN